MKSLNDYFDKIYCIHALGNAERKENIDQLRSFFNCEIEIVPASTPNNIKIPKNIKILPGEYGCTHSHLKTWNKILQDGAVKPLILEDDAVPTQHNLFDALDNYSEDGVGLLYLGLNFEHGKFTDYSEELYRVDFTYTTHAYAPHTNMLRKIIAEPLFDIEQLPNHTDHAIDVKMVSLMKRCKCLTFKRPLLSQMEGVSLIQNRYVNYDKWLIR